MVQEKPEARPSKGLASGLCPPTLSRVPYLPVRLCRWALTVTRWSFLVVVVPSGHGVWIKKNYPESQELIFTPKAGQQLKNGKEVPSTFYGPVVAKMHNNHIHWAAPKAKS